MFTITDINEQSLQQIMFFTDGNRDLYQLDVQVSDQCQEIQQNQDGTSIKQLRYIANLQQNLQFQYQSNKNQQTDTKQMDATKKKKIRKIKEYENKKLDRKIKKPKVQLNRLWALPLFHFLKGIFNKPSNLKKINRLKNQMLSASNIHQLSKVFTQHPWINKILQTQKENFLNYLNEQKINYQTSEQKMNNQTKLLLFQTIDILFEGIKHPESFIQWDMQINGNIKESKQLLMKFKDKNYQEIHKLAVLQHQRQKEHYQGNKCSTHNNISYFWFRYVKDIFQSEDFKSIYRSHQIYRRLQFTFSQSATILNIRNVLSIKQLAQYILKNKIKSKQILSQLMLDSKMSLLNKINMIISLNQFIMQPKIHQHYTDGLIDHY